MSQHDATILSFLPSFLIPFVYIDFHEAYVKEDRTVPKMGERMANSDHLSTGTDTLCSYACIDRVI